MLQGGPCHHAASSVQGRPTQVGSYHGQVVGPRGASADQVPSAVQLLQQQPASTQPVSAVHPRRANAQEGTGPAPSASAPAPTPAPARPSAPRHHDGPWGYE